MWVTDRQYQDNEETFRSLCELTIRLGTDSLRSRQHAADWSIGRIMDWKYGLWDERRIQPGFLESTARLWTDYPGHTVGAAISEGGGSDFQILLDHQYSFLYQTILNWILETPYRTESCSMLCPEDEPEKAAVLEDAGFINQGQAESTFTYTGNSIQLETPALQQGLTIGDIQSFGSVAAQMALKHAAFNPGKELTPHLVYAYHHVKTAPLYDAEMDIVISTAEGQAVAGCEGFIDYRNKHMEIERVCTHPDWQGRGLAKAAITECARRGIARGVEHISITGWNEQTRKLYASFGKCTELKRNHYLFKRA